jgi:hypothetical protein
MQDFKNLKAKCKKLHYPFIFIFCPNYFHFKGLYTF